MHLFKVSKLYFKSPHLALSTALPIDPGETGALAGGGVTDGATAVQTTWEAITG